MLLAKYLSDGMIIQPNTDLNLDCFNHADFAGFWINEDQQIHVQ